MDALSRVRLAELGYEVVLWDLDVVQSAETDAAVASLLSLARPGSVIRFSVTNDGSQAAAVLTGAIPALIAQGYEFVPACVGSPDR